MKKGILFSLLLTVFGLYAEAQLILGSYITYRSFDSVTYEVTITLYQSCYSNTPPKDSILIEWDGGSFKSRTYKTADKDVTGYSSNCPIQSRCSDTGKYGIRQLIYKDTISLWGINACEFKIVWNGERTPPNTGPTEAHYNYLTINKCLGTNISLVFLDPMKFLIPLANDVYLGTGQWTNNDNDSISFEFTCPLKSSSQSIVNNVSTNCSTACYNPFMNFPFTCRYCPFDGFLGAPNAGLNSPAGCRFDTETGNFSFRPTQKDEFKHYCLKATEWRKINGKQTPVALIRCDLSALVIDVGNKFRPSVFSLYKV